MADESNAVPFTVLDAVTVPQRIGLELEVYNVEDPTQIIDVVPHRTDVTSLDEMRNSGGGSFSVMRDDPKLTESPTLLSWRNVVKCRLDRQVVGAFVIQNKETDYVNPEERAGEYWEVSGEGLRTWFRDAVVLPYGGVKEDSQRSRVFSFASERGSWYNPADWAVPVKVHQYTMDPNETNPWGTAPAEWPDAPNAYWIWSVDNSATEPAPEGVNYFRFEFETTDLELKNYSVFCAADDDFDIYVDAAQVITSRETAGYAKTWRADFQLGPGTHVLAARVQNNSGPAALIAALFKAGDAASETAAELITVTGDPGWVVNGYPDPAPGWTPGEIMLTLLAEAEARGVRFPTFLIPTFTATADSEGAAWPRSLDWSFDVGTEYYNVIEMLEELVCDLWINPENFELNMYIERGSHRDVQSPAVQPVKFEIGRNVAKAGEEGTSDIKNTLLVEHSQGFGLESDGLTTSVTEYGRVEGFISTGASPSVSADVARAVFSQKAEPETSATFEIIDVDDARPFVDFFVGDWVLAPGEGGLEPRRIMSIAVTEDLKTGHPKFAVELDTIFEDRAQRYERWLRSTSDGTLGGTLANTGGGGGGGGTPSSQTTRSGPVGGTGLPGAPGEGLTWQGEWDVLTDYLINDAVKFEGRVWISIEENTGVEPSDLTPEWDLFLEGGTDGIDGKNVELQKTATEIQWRWLGESAWTTLVLLSDLKGEPGIDGDNGTGLVYRGDWDSLTQYVQNDIVTHASTQWITSVTTTGSEPGVGLEWETYAGGGGSGGGYNLGTAYKNDWVFTNAYAAGDVVVADGRSWVAVTDVPASPAPAVTFRGASMAHASGTSFTLAAPTGTQLGDFQVLSLATYQAHMGTVPEDFVLRGSVVGTGVSVRVYTRTVTTGDGSAFVGVISDVHTASLRTYSPAEFVALAGSGSGVTSSPVSSENLTVVVTGSYYSGVYTLVPDPDLSNGDGISAGYINVAVGDYQSLEAFPTFTAAPSPMNTYNDGDWVAISLSGVSAGDFDAGAYWKPLGVIEPSTAARASVTYTTATLAAGAREVGLVDLGPSYRIFKVSADRQCRVRLYDTTAHRDADVSRPKTTAINEETDHGLMLDAALQTGVLARTLSPVVDGVNFETGDAVALTVDNLDTTAGTVAVTLTYVKVDA